jgi:hypothetical protein
VYPFCCTPPLLPTTAKTIRVESATAISGSKLDGFLDFNHQRWMPGYMEGARVRTGWFGLWNWTICLPRAISAIG